MNTAYVVSMAADQKCMMVCDGKEMDRSDISRFQNFIGNDYSVHM